MITKTATHAGDTVRSAETLAPDEIRAQLRQILDSPVFHGSKRCQQFLDYVCDKALSGEPGALKERLIAIEVFGRHLDSAGHGEDTIVRVGAREVRKRLAQFYVTPEGAAAPIVIELPSGSYVPEFHSSVPRRPPVADPVSSSPEIRPAPSPVEPPPLRRAWVSSRISLVAGCLLSLVIAGFALVKRSGSEPGEAAFQRFWEPVFQSSQTLLIGVGHPIVYLPSHRAAVLSESRQPPSKWPVQRKIELPPNEINGSDMVPAMNQFVGFGDMVAANKITEMLVSRGHHARVMMASSIPFAELLSSQAFLIGSFSNQWTSELSHNWRFQFRWTEQHYPVFVDTQSQPPKEWSIPAEDSGATPDDYSLICRVRNSPTGALLVVAAGIKQFGTEAAGRILADPASLDNILDKLPRGWEDKSLQILLHTRVIGNTPAQPELVAWQIW